MATATSDTTTVEEKPKMKPLRLTMLLILLTCIYGSARADGIVLQVPSPPDPRAVARNNQRRTIDTNLAVPISDDSTIKGRARAIVVTPGPILPCDVFKLPGQECDTGIASMSGPTTVARARALATTSGSGLTNVLVGTAGSFAEVIAGMESGVATSSIIDPAIYDNAAGQTFALSFGLTAGFGAQAFIEGGGGTAFVSISTSAGSNIPGLETFFSWSLAVDGQDPSNLMFSFTSNPSLGLDDIAITNSFLSHLVFNPADGSYTLISDFDYVNFSVTVPVDQQRVELTWNTEAIAEASGVPEPATIFLLGTGLVALAGKVRSQKTKRI